MPVVSSQYWNMVHGSKAEDVETAVSKAIKAYAEEVIGGNPPGGLWQQQAELHDRMWDLLHAVLAPAALTRRACSAAVRTLLLQDRIRKGQLKKLSSHPGYPHGRELAIIQNNVNWHIETLEDTLVEPDPALLKRPSSGRRRGRRAKNDPGSPQ